jgi:methionine synthase I (cobalamin-dependent)
LSHPEIVRDVHEDYIRAGADVIIANTFATCRHVLAGAGLADRTVEINRRAVELAMEARERAGRGRPIAVAGSISNTVAWKPGTVGPDPRHFPTPAQEERNYREVAETFAEAGVDLIVMEMMLDIERARRAIAAAVATGLPVWIGISCTRHADGRMTGWDIAAEERGGIAPEYVPPRAPPLRDIIRELSALGGTVAGIMHSSIAATGPALAMLSEHWSGPVMAYPETLAFDPITHQARITVGPEAFARACRDWVERGVQIIGGCCGTTVDHIAAMAAQVPSKAGGRN